MTETPHPLYATHSDTLARALTAITERAYWSNYPESPSPRVYGEHAAAEGKAAFEALLGRDFPLDQPGAGEPVATEVSPFGVRLDVRYPHANVAALIDAGTAALPAWRDAGPQTRAGVCMEILARLHANIFELAHAVHVTSGQAFVMAFQAGGAHALDRALEAVAYGYAEMTRHPGVAEWEKPAGKGEPLRMTKTFHVVPRGLALVIGCNTFPTWNSYPGLFASLVTGNPVVVKPHPRRRAAAGDHRALRPPGAHRGRLRPEPGAARRRGARREARLRPRPAPRCQDRRLHRLHRVRRLARGARPAGIGLHREGRGQHHRRRLHRRLRRHVPQHRVLADALQRADVHHPAEPPHPGRRHRHRRRATRASTR